MDQLFRIKDSIAGLFSPRARRRQTITVSTPAKAVQRPVQPHSDPRGLKEKGIAEGRISKNQLSPVKPRNAPYHSFEAATASVGTEDESAISLGPDDGFGSSVEPEDRLTLSPQEPQVSPDDSVSQLGGKVGKAKARTVAKSDASYKQEEEDDAEDEPDPKAKVNDYLDRQEELERTKEAENLLSSGHWHPYEEALLRQLTSRGFRPLMPSQWNIDFRSYPPQLFTNEPAVPIINSYSGKDFRATLALEALTQIGCQVRALQEQSLPPEPLIKRGLENYIKWAEKDGGYYGKHFIPIHRVIAGSSHEATKVTVQAMEDQLEQLALKHHHAHKANNYKGELPVLYGMLVIGMTVAFITKDVSRIDRKAKMLSHFDFKDPGSDVWNGFSVAIAVCMMRDWMIDSFENQELEDESSMDEISQGASDG